MSTRKSLLEVIRNLRPDGKEFEEAISGEYSKKLLKAVLEKTLNSGIVLEGIEVEEEVTKVM